MDDERELERLEHDLAVIDARWSVPGYDERTRKFVLDQEHEAHHALTTAISALKARIAARPVVTPSSGTLRASPLGTWEPLVLFEGAQQVDGLPAFDVQRPAEDEETEFSPAENSNALWDLMLAQQERPVENAEFGQLIKRAKGDVATLSLIAQALRSCGRTQFADQVSRYSPPLLNCAWPTDETRWLDEVPNEVDGLTRTQSRALEAMREVAPPSGPPVELAKILNEVRVRTGDVDTRTVELAIIAAGHPQLRAFPFVEFRNLTGQFSPATASFTHARLTPLALEALDDSLAMPWLLLNGSETAERIPAHDVRTTLMAVRARAIPQTFMDSGFGRIGVEDRHVRARVSSEIDREARQARLVVHDLPWPLRAHAVARVIQSALVAGKIHGVTGVDVRVSSDSESVVIKLEHLSWAQAVERWLLRSDVTKMTTHYESKWSGIELLRGFVEHRKERFVRTLDRHVQKEVDAAAKAEAICLALELLEVVQGHLRAADDDASAALALTTCIKPEHRAAIARLSLPTSHAYETGFTLVQAKHLVQTRKLAARAPVHALQDWAARLRELDAARAALSSRERMLDLVDAEVLVALNRFGS